MDTRSRNISGAFNKLRFAAGSIYIWNIPTLVAIENSFMNLEKVGGNLVLQRIPSVATISNSFGSTTPGGNLTIWQIDINWDIAMSMDASYIPYGQPIDGYLGYPSALRSISGFDTLSFVTNSINLIGLYCVETISGFGSASASGGVDVGQWVWLHIGNVTTITGLALKSVPMGVEVSSGYEYLGNTKENAKGVTHALISWDGLNSLESVGGNKDPQSISSYNFASWFNFYIGFNNAFDFEPLCTSHMALSHYRSDFVATGYKAGLVYESYVFPGGETMLTWFDACLPFWNLTTASPVVPPTPSPVVPPTPSPTDSTNCTAGYSCWGKSCDDWGDLYGMSCEYLETDQGTGNVCDCSGCNCEIVSPTPSPTHPCAATSFLVTYEDNQVRARAPSSFV
jgi:hypothetical protein